MSWDKLQQLRFPVFLERHVQKWWSWTWIGSRDAGPSIDHQLTQLGLFMSGRGTDGNDAVTEHVAFIADPVHEANLLEMGFQADAIDRALKTAKNDYAHAVQLLLDH